MVLLFLMNPKVKKNHSGKYGCELWPLLHQNSVPCVWTLPMCIIILISLENNNISEELSYIQKVYFLLFHWKQWKMWFQSRTKGTEEPMELTYLQTLMQLLHLRFSQNLQHILMQMTLSIYKTLPFLII